MMIEDQSPFPGLTSTDAKEREAALRELELASPEIQVAELVSSLDSLLNEPDAGCQKLILGLLEDLVGRGALSSEPLSKKQFWYNWLDKFWPGPHATAVRILTPQLLAVAEPGRVLDNLVDFFKKTNVKFVKAVAEVLTENLDSFTQIFETRKTRLLELLDKQLPNLQLKAPLIGLLAKLTLVVPLPQLKAALKNLKKQLLEELEGNAEVASAINTSTPVAEEPESPADTLRKEELAYQSAKPQNLGGKFNDHWADQVLAMKKWVEKKEAVEGFLAEAEGKRLVPDGLQELPQLAKQLLQEANLQVQLSGLKILSALARGLRTAFHHSARSALGSLLRKLNSKQTPLVEGVLSTLSAFFHCCSLEEIAREVEEVNAQRNKDIRLQTIELLQRLFVFISTLRPAQVPIFFKLFSKMVGRFLEDQDIEVRRRASELVQFFRASGDAGSLAESHFDLSKLQAPRPASLPKNATSIASLTSLQVLPPTKTQVQPKAPVSTPAPVPQCRVKLVESHASKEDVSGDPEEYFPRIEELFGSEFVAQIKSNARDKAAAISDIVHKLAGLGISESLAVLSMIKGETRDFKEQNPIVLKPIFEALRELVTGPASECAFGQAAKLLLAKAGDKKFGAEAETLVAAAAGRLAFDKLFGRLADLCVSPRHLEAFALFLVPHVKPGITLSLSALMATAKIALNSPAQATRAAFLELLKALAPLLGHRLAEITQTIENKSLRASTQTLLDSLAPPTPVTPTPAPAPTPASPSPGRRVSEVEATSLLTRPEWRQRQRGVEMLGDLLCEESRAVSVDALNQLLARCKDAQRPVASAAQDALLRVVAAKHRKLGSALRAPLSAIVEWLADKPVRLPATSSSSILSSKTYRRRISKSSFGKTCSKTFR